MIFFNLARLLASRVNFFQLGGVVSRIAQLAEAFGAKDFMSARRVQKDGRPGIASGRP
jgi:hypothetical protein